MSYDIKLMRPIDSRIIEEDHIVENDNKTVILNKPMSNTSDVVVRVNDFFRDANFQTEITMREDVTSQFTGTSRIFFVAHGPIYNGLKLKQLATNFNDIVIRIKITNEDVSGQFTGIENYFYTEGRPFLRANNYDFNSFITKSDITIKINGTPLAQKDISDINSTTGRINLNVYPLITDVVTISYYFRATIKELDAENSKIVIKEIPQLGQEVKVQYFSLVSDGWSVQKSQRSTWDNAKDIIFSKYKITNRILVSLENVTGQFTGKEYTFKTAHAPLLPLFQDYTNTFYDTLNNAVVVSINGKTIPVSGLNSKTGEVRISVRPQPGDIVLVSYYYQNVFVPDRISVDYSVDSKYSEKHKGNINLADYKVDVLGHYEIVENENKLIQDLRKIIITVRGSDTVATWYGTTFEKIIATKQLPNYVKTRISGEIIEALTRYKNAQIQQEEYQEVTPNEFLDFIKKIQVDQNTYDASYYRAVVDVVTQAGKAYELNEPIFYPEDILYPTVPTSLTF